MTIHTNVNTLLLAIKNNTAHFSDVLTFIDARYNATPVSFKNGEQLNASHENQGSAKVFSLAQLFSLSKDDTLALFAEHYQSVINTPNDTDHANIRNFMQHGWDGLSMNNSALTQKT